MLAPSQFTGDTFSKSMSQQLLEGDEWEELWVWGPRVPVAAGLHSGPRCFARKLWKSSITVYIWSSPPSTPLSVCFFTPSPLPLSIVITASHHAARRAFFMLFLASRFSTSSLDRWTSDERGKHTHAHTHTHTHTRVMDLTSMMAMLQEKRKKENRSHTHTLEM